MDSLLITNNAPQGMLESWILKDNLKLFVEIVSDVVEYDLTDLDWDAIRFGVASSDYERNQWYDYSFCGEQTIFLWFALSDQTNRIFLRAKSAKYLLARVAAIAEVLQHYSETNDAFGLNDLIAQTFSRVPYPGDKDLLACTADHFAVCLECQEAWNYFRGKDWKELLQQNEEPPYNVAGPDLLTPIARRYFFPAYLIIALRRRRSDILEKEFSDISKTINDFTVLQRELATFAERILRSQT